MMNREQRALLAMNTVAIVERGQYIAPSGRTVDISSDVQRAVSNTRLLRPEAFASLSSQAAETFSTRVEVTDETTLQAAARLAGPASGLLCLNFASAKGPGGGFLSGSQAQEESLARSSALYASLSSQMEMYEYNRELDTCLYSDYMILSPDVPVFRDDSGTLLEEPYLASFLTAPAVNTGAVRRNEPHNVPLIQPTMRERLRKVLLAAQHFGYTSLVLGAWGCGVFHNEPTDVARLFSEALAPGAPFGSSFKHIVYAIYDMSLDKPVLKAFQHELA